MTTIQLIEKHFEEHGGKSSYIDRQLHLAKQAAKDAALSALTAERDALKMRLERR